MIDFIKKNVLLALDAPKRNLIGDLIIGWNHSVIKKNQTKISLEQAHRLMALDIEACRKEADRIARIGHNDVVVFILFYIGPRRWPEAEDFLKRFKGAEKVEELASIAVDLSNSRWFKNNPSLATILCKKIIAMDTSLG